MPQRPSSKAKPPPRRAGEFPPQSSSGYLVRDAHRAFQRLLERRIGPFGVTRGQWYFLAGAVDHRRAFATRARRGSGVWSDEVIALRSMEKSGLIPRRCAAIDRPPQGARLLRPRRQSGRAANCWPVALHHHRRGGEGHRAARSRGVPPHRGADDGKFGSDRTLEQRGDQPRHRLAKPARPMRETSSGGGWRRTRPTPGNRHSASSRCGAPDRLSCRWRGVWPNAARRSCRD